LFGAFLNNPIAAKERKELRERRSNPNPSAIFAFFCGKNRFLNGHGFDENAVVHEFAAFRGSCIALRKSLRGNKIL
jgi:hypothetical protein